MRHFIHTQASNAKEKHKDTKMQMQKRNRKCKKDTVAVTRRQASNAKEKRKHKKCKRKKETANAKKIAANAPSKNDAHGLKITAHAKK